MRLVLKLFSVCIVLSFFGVASVGKFNTMYSKCSTFKYLCNIAAKSGVDLLPGRDVCGIQEENRIYGGEETALGEFPWMALLGIRRECE